MTNKRYEGRLTDLEVIQLLEEGAYTVDLETGITTSRKTGRPVYTFEGNDEGYLFIRLYKNPKNRAMPVSCLVWLAGNRIPIPEGFQVHHWDVDNQNNAFKNLYALSTIDHKKIHNLIEEDEIPF